MTTGFAGASCVVENSYDYSSCGKVMFLQACVKNSVHGGSRQTPPPSGRHLPQADTPLVRQTPPETATAADGTHPTGMHSCFSLFKRVFFQMKQLLQRKTDKVNSSLCYKCIRNNK